MFNSIYTYASSFNEPVKYVTNIFDNVPTMDTILTSIKDTYDNTLQNFSDESTSSTSSTTNTYYNTIYTKLRINDSTNYIIDMLGNVYIPIPNINTILSSINDSYNNIHIFKEEEDVVIPIPEPTQSNEYYDILYYTFIYITIMLITILPLISLYIQFQYFNQIQNKVNGDIGASPNDSNDTSSNSDSNDSNDCNDTNNSTESTIYSTDNTLYIDSISEIKTQTNKVNTKNTIDKYNNYKIFIRIKLKNDLLMKKTKYQLNNIQTIQNNLITNNMYMICNVHCNTDFPNFETLVISYLNYLNNVSNEDYKNEDFIILAIGKMDDKLNELYNNFNNIDYELSNIKEIIYNITNNKYYKYMLTLPVYDVYNMILDSYNEIYFETKNYSIDESNNEKWKNISLDRIANW